MTDDDKAALIAEALARTTEHARQNPEGSVDLARRLALALSEAQPDLERVKREAGAAALREAAEAADSEGSHWSGAPVKAFFALADDFRERAEMLERGE